MILRTSAGGKPSRQHGVAVELPVRIVGREQQQFVGPHVLEQALERFGARAARRTGCMVRRTLERTISAGARSTQGISMRSPRQNFVSRHRCAGSQVKPDSSSTTFRSGNLVNTPSQIRLESACWNAGGLRDVVLGVVGRPADAA